MIMALDQRQRQPRLHQRLQPRASRCQLIFVLMLTSCWLLSSSVVQAVLTEDDIIDKELTWAAMARKVQKHRVGAPNTKKPSKNDNDDEEIIWTRDVYDWTHQERQQDRLQLQLQQEEQPRQRRQLRIRR
jgi:hypothetical protein